MKSTGSDHDLWKTIPQIAYYVVAMIAAIAALVVYRRNHRLEQSRWLSNLYEKFYETDKYKRVRELLDSKNTHDINELVENEDPEHVAIFAGSKQLRADDVEASFCYYLDCLERHQKVHSYINDHAKGYENLRAFLGA